jgi:hypothetical protein
MVSLFRVAAGMRRLRLRKTECGTNACQHQNQTEQNGRKASHLNYFDHSTFVSSVNRLAFTTCMPPHSAG